MRYFPYLVLTFSLLILSFQGKGQSAGSDRAGMPLSVSVQPLFLFNRGFHFDVELQLPEKKSAFIIAPELYAGSVSDIEFAIMDTDGDDKVKGYGLGVMHKIKFEKNLSSTYFAYGLQYRNHNIDFEDKGYSQFRRDDLIYYEYGPYSDNLKINSYLVRAIVGQQRVYSTNILLDYYVGLGYKEATKTSGHPDARKYNQTFSSYAYRGTVMIMGFKIGLQLHK